MKFKTKEKTKDILSFATGAVIALGLGGIILPSMGEEKEEIISSDITYLNVVAMKEEVSVKDMCTEELQKELAKNLRVNYIDSNGKNSGWFQADLKSGTYEGSENEFVFETIDGYFFGFVIEEDTVLVTGCKSDAYDLALFEIKR